MKRMRDYSKWGLLRLAKQAKKHRRTIIRCEAAGTSCAANKLVLAEINRQIVRKLT